MSIAIVGVGSNIDPESNIPAARDLLEAQCTWLGSSPFVTTAPIGVLDQADFANGCWRVETTLDADAFTELLKSIEDRLGRDRTAAKFGPRTIDLDLVVWNEKIVDSDVHERAFLRDAVKALDASVFDDENN